MHEKLIQQILANSAEMAEEFENKRVEYNIVFANFLSKLGQAKTNELAMLANIGDSVSVLDMEKLAARINGYLSENEKNYLMAKELSEYITISNHCESFDALLSSPPPEKLGVSDYFNTFMEKVDGGYRLHLPPMCGKKHADRFQGDGKAAYYTVSTLVRDFENRNDILKIVPNPIAIFVHNIQRGNEMLEVLDADNIDVKVSIDALFGFLINDDNVLSLSTMHLGTRCDEESSCDIYIINKANFADWCSDHSELFAPAK